MPLFHSCTHPSIRPSTRASTPAPVGKKPSEPEKTQSFPLLTMKGFQSVLTLCVPSTNTAGYWWFNGPDSHTQTPPTSPPLQIMITHSRRRCKSGLTSDSIAARCQPLIAVVPVLLPHSLSPASHVFSCLGRQRSSALISGSAVDRSTFAEGLSYWRH